MLGKNMMPVEMDGSDSKTSGAVVNLGGGDDTGSGPSTVVSTAARVCPQDKTDYPKVNGSCTSNRLEQQSQTQQAASKTKEDPLYEDTAEATSVKRFGREISPVGSISARDPNISMSRTRIGRVLIDRETGSSRIIDEADWEGILEPERRFAILVRTRDEWLDSNEFRTLDVLELLSPNLARLFQSVVKYFPGIQVEGARPSMPAPYAPLYFHYCDIVKAAKSADKCCQDDFEVLHRFYCQHIEGEHQRIREMLAGHTVLYNDLWALFRPGDIIYVLDEYNEPRLYILITVKYRRSEGYFSSSVNSIQRFHRLAADMWAMDWQQSTGSFQRHTVTRCIKSFSGSRSVTSLPFYPLSYYAGGCTDQIDKLVCNLRLRGLKWKELVSKAPSCVFYDGPARIPPQATARGGPVIYSRHVTEQHLSERVIVDGSLNALLAAGSIAQDDDEPSYFRPTSQNFDTPVFGLGLDTKHQHFDDFPPDHDFVDLQAQLCPSCVLGYGIKSRSLFTISITRITAVDWVDSVIESLVVESRTKRLLLGLVDQHRRNKEHSLTDIIPSKGKGLIIALHGPPGVGKTLTAEAIAEHTHKPLYPINVGELTNDDDIVSKLETHFTSASQWDAVLLLDEADVLLEQRSFEDIKRNGIVSAFLRMLEYYEGILFLTTNRLMTMDGAFQSRIHFAVKYPELTPPLRRKIWEIFINRLNLRDGGAKQELLDHLDDMQEWDLNGRQIRNVLMTAEALSFSTRRLRGALEYSDIEDMANETMRFQCLFEDNVRARKTQISSLGSREFHERKMTTLR